MLATKGENFEGKRVALSGFGNVAWGAAIKVNDLGGKVFTISGPDRCVYDPEGISGEKIEYLLELRSSNPDIVKPYTYEFPEAQFHQEKHPWEVECDVAIPSATQNELNEEDGFINYVKGANIAGFLNVANAMMDQGIV